MPLPSVPPPHVPHADPAVAAEDRRLAVGLCLAVACMVLYGSWFPFEWIRPDPDDVAWALSDLTLWTGRADLLGNVALFVPWGAAAAWAARAGGRRPAAWALGGGLVLALAAQAGQFFEAHRDPRWADVTWNLAGAAIGLVAARRLARRLPRAAVVLLAGSLAVAWLPGWPALDPQRLAVHWSNLARLGAWQGPEAAMMAGLALVAGAAAAALRPARPRRALLVAALAMAAGQMLVPGSRLSAGGLLGLAAGAALAAGLHASPRGMALALAGLQVAGGLAPFDIGPLWRPFHWMPFEAMLGGSMLGNTQALARDLWLWGCALWMAAEGGIRVVRATAGCAAAALAVEIVQCAMPSRTADLTPALLVLALGWAVGRRSSLRRLAGPVGPAG